MLTSLQDVFSYAEDDMVEDPLLAQHLAHFGINIAALEKVNIMVKYYKYRAL